MWDVLCTSCKIEGNAQLVNLLRVRESPNFLQFLEDLYFFLEEKDKIRRTEAIVHLGKHDSSRHV